MVQETMPPWKQRLALLTTIARFAQLDEQHASRTT
jgi:hypothetical protein